MSLLEKIDKYANSHSQSELAAMSKEILTDLRALITDLKDENALPETTQENLKKLQESYLKLPQIFVFNNSQDLLEIILDLSSSNIYKTYYDISFDFVKPAIQDLQIKNQDDLVLLMLAHYLEKISTKELFGYLKIYNEKKQRNPQLKLLIIELLHYVLLTIEKKEVFLNDLLPTLLKTLNPSLARYIKYKTKVDNNQYGETPKNIVQYLLNYENWAKSLLQKILKTLVEVINPHKGERRLLLINDIYDINATQNELKRKTPSTDKLITHYCVLFILDIFEGLIDCRGNAYFLKENIDSFIENIVKTLLEIHPNLHDYIKNYLSQRQIKKIDGKIEIFNQKNEFNLQVGNYDMLTHYNPASVAYLAVRLMQSPKEAILLTLEYKLQIFLPCLYPIFLNTFEKNELKSDLLTTVSQLFQSLATHQNTPLDNLNKFEIPLDKVVERILDHTGGTPNEKDRTLGIEIFVNVKNLLTEKALANLLISAIVPSRSHGLFTYLITEYKTGITNALKNCNTIDEIREKFSPFLNANYLRKLLEIGIDSKSKKFKDNGDLISCCVNIFTLVFMKLSNLFKNTENYAALKFKDPSNLFSPINLKILLDYGEKIQGLQEKIKDDIKMWKSQIEKMSQENPENLNIEFQQVKLNELYMISDSIERIGEIYQDLNLSQKLKNKKI